MSTVRTLLCIAPFAALIIFLLALTVDTVYDNIHKENSRQNFSITLEFFRGLNYISKN